MYNLYNDEIYAKVSRKNKDLLQDYILEMRAEGKSKGTISQYTADIKGFFCWLHENQDNIFVLECKKRVFRRFFLDCQEMGSSSARINRQQCSLRTMLSFAESDDDEYEKYEVNQMRTVKGLQKESVRDIIFLEDYEVRDLLKELLARGKYRQAMFVAIAYESGARKNELAQIDRESFYGAGNETNIVVGKRNKKFRLRFYKWTKGIYFSFIEEEGIKSGPLFYNTRKDEREPLTIDNYYQWIVDCRKVLADIGYDYRPFNVHSFRHSCAENLLNGTHRNILTVLKKDHLDIKEIQLLLHHKSVETTEIYVRDRTEERERELYEVDLDDL